MKFLLVSLFLIIGTNANASCPMSFEQTGLCAQLEWVDGPYLNTVSHFKIKFHNQNDEDEVAISPQFDIKIYTWMIMASGHSHGGPALNWQEISNGIFESKDARFFMGGMNGYWEIRVDLNSNGSLISRSSQKVEF